SSPHTSFDGSADVAALPLPGCQDGLSALNDRKTRVNHRVGAVAAREQVIPYHKAAGRRHDSPTKGAKVSRATPHRLLQVHKDRPAALAARMRAPCAAVQVIVEGLAPFVARHLPWFEVARSDAEHGEERALDASQCLLHPFAVAEHHEARARTSVSIERRPPSIEWHSGHAAWNPRAMRSFPEYALAV